VRLPLAPSQRSSFPETLSKRIMALCMSKAAVFQSVNKVAAPVAPKHRATPVRSYGPRARSVVVKATAAEQDDISLRRRAFLTQTSTAVTLLALSEGNPMPALAESPLCDADCLKALESAELITTASGLQYKEIVKGTGPKPFTGVQVVADFVAMVKNQKDGSLFVFENTLDKGKPQDIRVTGDPESATVIVGLDEGLMSMRVGGIRRMYIPGALAFPNGLASAPGRPRVAPKSDVVFDVWLRYIPGLDDDEDDEDYVLEI